MNQPISVRELDFSPKPGKTYWNCEREWREEFIYFLMVDRFHDGKARKTHSGPSRAKGYGDAARLRRFCGGTLRGITQRLDYINGLGCTAVWLSPIFENDGAPDPSGGSYHGYAIRNYLNIDPRFGTKDDLCELVDEAHRRGMRVFLDAVANHAGDVWRYPGDYPYFYSSDHRQFPLEGFRHPPDPASGFPGYPLPVELQNPAYYHRRGQIRDDGWDRYPETQWGDFFTLKGFNNDEDPAGIELQKVIIDCHKYWVREADIDGYRMDAVKHMGETAIARFCQGIREYAYALGKREFMLFGELVGGDEVIHRYTGPNTAGQLGDKTVYYGLSSVLDFPLYWTLPSVLKGFESPSRLGARYDALRGHALSRGELGRYLVTFVDNHDQIGQNYKRRFAAGATDEQVIAGLGWLLCALGTPCVYYGTEQGLEGEGHGDEFIREALFDPDDPARDILNPDCRIYRETAAIARVNRENPALRFGRMYMRDVSGDGVGFRPPDRQPCTLAFSRVLADREVLVAYNTSTTETREDFVIVDSAMHAPGSTMRYLYGGSGTVEVHKHRDHPVNDSRFVRIGLAPMQFVILG